MENYHRLYEFLCDEIEHIVIGGGSGHGPRPVPFELSAQNYLGFAEEELTFLETQDKTAAHPKTLINAVSYLKRAVDCQIDTFLYSYGLLHFFDSKNPGIDKKLQFLACAWLFEAQSLSRLNRIRNRMEHKYEVPKIEEIRVYFDLTAAFTRVLAVYMANATSTGIYCEIFDDDGQCQSYFSIVMDDEPSRIEVRMNIGDSCESFTVEFDESPFEFACIWRALLILHQLPYLGCSQALKMLDPENLVQYRIGNS